MSILVGLAVIACIAFAPDELLNVCMWVGVLLGLVFIGKFILEIASTLGSLL